LAFHDATTFEYGPNYVGKGVIVSGGPNGSIRYEVDRPENRGIGRPLKAVQSVLDNRGDYSLALADAIALAGATAVEAAGGPHIPIRMGRQDVDQADPEFLRIRAKKSTPRSLVEKTLPSAALDSDGLRLYYGRLGLTEKEFVALNGCHGMGRHVSLLGMPKSCLKNLTRTCLEEAPVLLPFVTESVDRFDNSYFRALLRWDQNEVSLGEVAFIPTDVALVVDSSLRRHVETFANDQEQYFEVFTRAYQRLTESTATSIQRH
jgi:L-ascorbate peroxidase